MITITDCDSDMVNGGISLQIVSGNVDRVFTIFDLGYGIYFLQLAKALDREKLDSYDLELLAEDNGYPQ